MPGYGRRAPLPFSQSQVKARRVSRSAGRVEPRLPDPVPEVADASKRTSPGVSSRVLGALGPRCGIATRPPPSESHDALVVAARTSRQGAPLDPGTPVRVSRRGQLTGWPARTREESRVGSSAGPFRGPPPWGGEAARYGVQKDAQLGVLVGDGCRLVVECRRGHRCLSSRPQLIPIGTSRH